MHKRNRQRRNQNTKQGYQTYVKAVHIRSKSEQLGVQDSKPPDASTLPPPPLEWLDY